MTLFSATLFAFAFGLVLIAALCLIKRQDKIAFRYLIFSICAAGWAFPFSLWITGQYEAGLTDVLNRVSLICAVWIPATWIHFIFNYIGRSAPFKGFMVLIYGFAFALSSTVPTSLFIEKTAPVLNLPYYSHPGPLYHLFTGYFIFFVLYGFVVLWKHFRGAYGEERMLMKYIFAAMSLAFGFGSITFLPVYGLPIKVELLSFLCLYPFLMGIALMRHGFFDADEIVDVLRKTRLAEIGLLTTSINHEIRNPLYIIQGMAQTSLSISRETLEGREEFCKTAQDSLSRISEQSSRAVEMIRRFAFFAKQPLQKEPIVNPVHLSAVINAILPLVEQELEHSNIKVAIQLSDELPAVRVDVRHLEEIIFNLLLNAIQALKKQEGGNIQITAFVIKNKLRIEISDDGPGIPKKDQSKIFQPLYSTKSDGTGLGLYITKQLVQRNGGKIFVRSKESHGTSFVLEFPR